jgi:hypothetical protein
MQHFLHTVAPPSTEESLLTEDHSPDYLMFLHRSSVNPARWFSSYLVRIDDQVSAAMTCWDQHFDPIFEKFGDPDQGPILSDEFRRIWPNFFAVIDNALDERYGDGALTQFIDPDDMNRKWFVAVLFHSSSSSSNQDYEKAVLNAIDAVVTRSHGIADDLLKELPWKSMVRIGFRGGAVGYRKGKAISDKWKQRLEWLQFFVG